MYWNVHCSGADLKEDKLEIDIILKIAAVGILVSVVCQVLKQSGRDEYIYLVSLSGIVLVLFWVLPYVSDLFNTIMELFSL